MEYVKLIFKGVAYGTVMAFMMGPVFFTLIRTSIQNGAIRGSFMAIGIALSETFIITISYISIASLADSFVFKTIMGMVGGVLMMTFGAISFFKHFRRNNLLEGQPIPAAKHKWNYILQGFFLNALNPFVYLFWITLISADVLKNEYTPFQAFILFSGTITVIFSTDLFKAYLAEKISKYLTQELLVWVDRIVGIVLIIFGLRLMYYGIFNI